MSGKETVQKEIMKRESLVQIFGVAIFTASVLVTIFAVVHLFAS